MDKIEKLVQYLKDSPTDDFLNHAYALELIKIGDDAKARLTFEALLDRNPKYVGSYYHLGKLLERQNDFDQAIAIYAKGMEVALAANDKHAHNELQMAKEEIEEW